MYGIYRNITERRQTEDSISQLLEELHQTSELLERTSEMAKVGGWELDLATNLVMYTKEAVRIHEFDLPYVSPNLSQGDKYYPPEAWPIILDAVQNAIDYGTPYDLESPFITAKGRRIWVRIQGFAVQEYGKTVKLRGTIQDITERKLLEESAKENQNKFASAFESASIGMAIVSTDGAFIQVNKSFCNMLGYSEEEILSLTFMDITYPDDLAIDLENVRKMLCGEISTYRMEKRYIDKKGNLMWGLLNVSLISDSSNQPQYFISQIVDINQQKKAIEELIKNERRMISMLNIAQYQFTDEQSFLDHALEEIICLTQSEIGYIYFYNEQNQQFNLNSWSRGVMKECLITEQQSIYDLDKTGIWGEAVRQRRPILLNDFQACNSLKKGIPEGHVTLRRFLTVPVFIDGVIVAVVGVANKESDYTDADEMQLKVFMDSVWKITAQKRAENEKHQLEIQLQQAQKMESVGRLAGGVAHDFNNLLTVILGGAELALNELEPGQTLHEYVTQIKDAAYKSSDLTQQLLAFARKQPIAPKVLDLNEVIASMLKMLQRLIGEEIKLKWQPETDLWPVKADPSQIDQILANLCVNARDAITGTGTITIQTGNSVIDTFDKIEHPYLVPGDYVHISVCDSGSGMDQETLAHAFEPFYTTKSSGEGTGLGLATVYGAAKQNNGFVNVQSELGIGTTFTIYLPRCVGSSDQIHQKGQSKPAPRGSETILLVEDEPAILNIVKLILSNQGYFVLAASSPSEAARLAGEHSGNIDLLITDVIMPEMNGKDLAQNLLSLHPNLKCLFMSGYTADIISRHGVLAEGTSFINKPFSLPDLAAKVRAVLEG